MRPTDGKSAVPYEHASMGKRRVGTIMSTNIAREDLHVPSHPLESTKEVHFVVNYPYDSWSLEEDNWDSSLSVPHCTHVCELCHNFDGIPCTIQWERS